jgi:hypothetical protein
MFHHRMSLLVPPLVVILSLAVISTPRVNADQPQLVLRTFGYMPINESPLPDWLGDGSVGMTILPDAVSPGIEYTITFCNACPGPFAGTTWRFHPVRHTTVGGQIDNGIYFWLVTEETPDPPPAGTHTLTGPEGLLSVDGDFRIAPCSEWDCLPTDWEVVNTGSSASKRFVIGHAWFSR